MMTLALLILLQQQFGTVVWKDAVHAYDDLFAFLAHHIAFREVRAFSNTFFAHHGNIVYINVCCSIICLNSIYS